MAELIVDRLEPIEITEQERWSPGLAITATEGNAQRSGELGAIVAQKAWNDGAFATQLAQDARKALEAVLKAYDVAVPAGKTVRAYFESATECVVIIPAAASSQELTDEELEAVAGGEELVLAATAIVTVAVAETLCS